MGPRTILVYLEDEEFAVRLTAYWSKNAPQFRFGVCTDEEEAKRALNAGPVYLFISDEKGFARIDWENIHLREIGRLVCLEDDEDETVPFVLGRMVSSVDRYQPADVLLAEALGMRDLVNVSFIGEESAFGQTLADLDLPVRPFSEMGMEVTETEKEYFNEEEDADASGMTRVVGVYSPIGRCGKSRFALQLSREYAKNGKTVFISFEKCSDLYEWTVRQNRTSVSDLIYMMRTDSEKKLAEAFSGEGHDIGEPIFFASAANPDDVSRIKEEELEALVSLASGEGITSIVIDVGSTCSDPYEVLTVCDEVFSPVTDTEASRKKWSHFNSFIKKKDRKKILQRIETVHLPDMGDAYDQSGFPVISEEGRSFVEKLVSRGENHGVSN